MRNLELPYLHSVAHPIHALAGHTSLQLRCGRDAILARLPFRKRNWLTEHRLAGSFNPTEVASVYAEVAQRADSALPRRINSWLTSSGHPSQHAGSVGMRNRLFYLNPASNSLSGHFVTSDSFFLLMLALLG